MIYERRDAWTHDVVFQQQVVAAEFIMTIKCACNIDYGNHNDTAMQSSMSSM